MSNVVSKESNQNLAFMENNDSSYQAKTLKTQLEWESVYLDLQKKHTVRCDSSHRNSAKLETDSVESNDVNHKYLDKSDNRYSSKEAGNAIKASENVFGSVASFESQNKSLTNKLNVSSAFGLNAVTRPVSANYAAAKTVYTNSNRNIKQQLSAQMPDVNVTAVSNNNDKLKVWVRSANIDVFSVNKVVDSLKSVFLKLGMRVTEITLNGEKVWVGNMADVDKHIPENSKKHINTVY